MEFAFELARLNPSKIPTFLDEENSPQISGNINPVSRDT